MGEYGISQSLSRLEDPRLLTGGGDYIDDGNENSQLYGVVVRSPHSHAEIASIDVSKARGLDGVVGVYTGRDYREAGWGAIPHIGPAVKRRNGADLITPDFYPLALDRVRMVGEGVAFVVAETEIQARDAAERVIANYVPLQSSADTMTALEPGTPVLWPDIGDNEALVHEIGDKSATERAFAEADHVIEQRFTINRVLGNAMEIRACLAIYDARSNHYTLRAPVQHPWLVRKVLASSIIGTDELQIRVVAPDVGGSFGIKAKSASKYSG